MNNHKDLKLKKNISTIVFCIWYNVPKCCAIFVLFISILSFRIFSLFWYNFYLYIKKLNNLIYKVPTTDSYSNFKIYKKMYFLKVLKDPIFTQILFLYIIFFVFYKLYLNSRQTNFFHLEIKIVWEDSSLRKYFFFHTHHHINI